MSNNKDTLGDRMKQFEEVSSSKLIRRMPVILRLDGKAFHTFTRGFEKPFDKLLSDTMIETTFELVANIQNCQMGYVQSDEISLLLMDDKHLNTSSWFDNKVQKQVSVAASMCTLYFNTIFMAKVEKRVSWELMTDEGVTEQTMLYRSKTLDSLFDCRAFNIPKEDVCNYFIWRQQDATRNSIQSLAQANFSHKSLHGLSCNALQDKLFTEKKINWNDYITVFKRGTSVVRNLTDEGSAFIVDREIPIFSQDRTYVEKFVNIRED
jgi:tRNA(His) 5'-end guanylyltransferase